MGTLIEMRKELIEKLSILKEKGIRQNKFSETYKKFIDKDFELSQSEISKAKKSNSIRKIHPVLKYVTNLLAFIEKNPSEFEQEIIDKIKVPKIKKADIVLTWPSVVNEFVSKEINNFISKNGVDTILKIDAIGMKLGSLFEVLFAFLKKEKLPKLELNCVLIDPAETGIKIRSIIEGETQDYKFNLQGGFLKWQNFCTNVINKEGNSFHFRLLRPDPNIYMIRIEERMLISPYLRDVGNTSYYESINKTDELKKFTDYYNLYEKYFTNNYLSRLIDWNEINVIELFESSNN